MKIFKSLFYFFLVAVFLIKVPPFYYLPIHNRIYSSHTLAKIIIGFIFLILFLINYQGIVNLINKKRNIFIILFFFISQSLSIISALDVILFWKSYHNLIFSLFIFLLSFLLVKLTRTRKTIKMLELFFIFNGLVLVFLELVLLIIPKPTLNFFSRFIQKEILDAYIVNFNRGRTSLESNVELFLPIFLSSALFYKNQNPNKSIFFFLISLMIFFLSIISNFRTRVVVSFFSILMVLIIFYFKKIKENSRFELRSYAFNLLVIILIFFIIGRLTLNLSTNLFSFNVVDRLIFENETRDSSSTNYRIISIDKSLEIFRTFPLIGIGLGNFIYFNSSSTGIKYSLIASESEKRYYERVFESPHNIFAQILAETGIMGIFSFLLLIFYFIVKDYRLFFHSKRKYIYGYIIASWEVFIFALFNPASTIFVIGWFWFLRGIIENLDKH